MSYTAATTTDLSPAHLSLDAFGYPPPKDYHQSPNPKQRPTETPPAAATDDEDVFSLDMVTMDMGFEQAYYMYMLMQQKSALNGVEELQRAQQMEPHLRPHQGPLKDRALCDPKDHALLRRSKASLLSPPGEAPEETFNPHMMAVQLPDKRYADSLTGYPGSNVQPKMFVQKTPHAPRPPHMGEQEEFDDDDEESHDELDQFFSTTESSALDKFLDNLASSSLSNPLDLYSLGQPASSPMFDLRTMGEAEQRLFEGYSAPNKEAQLVSAMQNAQFHNQMQPQPLGVLSEPSSQLPTPSNSRQVSTAEQGKMPLKRESTEPSEQPKRRKIGKALLSLAQKRLNHSHSEQKRRLLCKQAYERCLRLVTNVDDYRNELVSASALTSSNKNSKRKQINKDGLPNLSKHAALLKIGYEIIKIRDKNEKLQELIAAYN